MNSRFLSKQKYFARVQKNLWKLWRHRFFSLVFNFDCNFFQGNWIRLKMIYWKNFWWKSTLLRSKLPFWWMMLQQEAIVLSKKSLGTFSIVFSFPLRPLQLSVSQSSSQFLQDFLFLLHLNFYLATFTISYLYLSASRRSLIPHFFFVLDHFDFNGTAFRTHWGRIRMYWGGIGDALGTH